MKRNHTVDFMKGVCMLFVITTHAPFTNAERRYLLFPFWIGMAVPIMMLLSGEMYALSLNRRGASSLAKILSAQDVTKKLLRFTVPFLIAFAAEQIIFLFVPQGHSFDLLSLTRSFLLGGEGPGSYYWPFMIQFIFAAPLIFLTVRRYAEKGVALCFGINILYEILQSAFGMSAACYRLLLFRYLFVIAFGCYLALCGDGIAGKWYLASFLAGIAFIVLVKYLPYRERVITHWKGTSCFAALYVIPLWHWIRSGWKEELSFPPLEMIGRASYNIFLVQMVYYAAAFDTVAKLVPNRIALLLISLVLCIGVGILFYQIETPRTKWLTAKCTARLCARHVPLR